MRIPYVDIAGQHAPLKTQILEAISSVIDSGQFVLGPQVSACEETFAEICGTRYAVGVNSGTDALVLAMAALGIGSGDEVITVPNSFVASTSAIMLVGAKPVFVDVCDSFCMDVSKLKQVFTDRTRAILPVHLTGRPVDMDPIQELAEQRGLYVIEDAAQAIMAEYRGRRVGSLGTVGCFSVHPLKTLNACGDGGMITTDDGQLAENLKLRRNLGLQVRDNCTVWSGNSRLDSIQAAVLSVKMRYLEEWTRRRREHAGFYRNELAEVPGLKLPAACEHEKPVYHTFMIQAEDRDRLKEYLSAQGVETAIHYPRPIHLQDAAAELGYNIGDFPITESQSKKILSLPVYPELETYELQYVVRKIQEFYTEN